MSSYYSRPVTTVVMQPPSNGLAVAGFVCAMLGLFSCGILSPIGLILSLLGLMKAPRGLAIAGSIISFVSLIPLLIFGGAVVTMALAAIGVATAAQQQMQVATANHTAAHDAAVMIENAHVRGAVFPSDAAGTALIAGKVDFWKTPLHYHRTENSFEIISAGADRQFGTADDLNFSETQLMEPTTAPMLPSPPTGVRGDGMPPGLTPRMSPRR